MNPEQPKLPITATISGIEFTFERKSCGKNSTGYRICRHMPRPIGAGHSYHYSQRIGICTKVEDFSVQRWQSTEPGLSHIKDMLEKRQKEIAHDDLRAAVPLRNGDSIVKADIEREFYTIVLKGLTRDQVVAAYKAAIAVLEE